jgi:CTD kinase subunit alpha
VPTPSGRGHFQNLSWTPDKGSRGGVAPTERVNSTQNKESNDGQASKDGDSSDSKTLPDSDAKIVSTSTPKLEALAKPDERSDDRIKEARAPPTGPSASSKPGIKFELKIQSQSALPKKPNVIQSALKAPARPAPPPTPPRPSPFGDSRPPESLRLGTQPPSGPRRDDWRHAPGRDSRGVPLPSPITTRAGPESWDRNKHEVSVQKAIRAPKRRQKKMVKVSTMHRRVVLPIRKLPVNWAQSEFVYYPKPDGESVVGAGTYGKVFKAHNVYLSKVVALKTLPLTKLRRKAGLRDLYINKKRKRNERWIRDGLHLTSLREIKLLKSISHMHENIVGIREIFLESDSCNLVFDYFEFDMHGIIYSSQIALEDSMIKDLCRQVFCGLDFLHTRANILHRDIKAANILVSTAGQVRITDFGLAKHVKTQAELDAEPWYKKKFEHSNRVITTPYRPPELFLGATLYGGEVDVWSAGCVLFEAYLRKLPFQGNGEDVDHLITLWKILGRPNVKTYQEILDLEWFWLIFPHVKRKKSIFSKLYKHEVTPKLYHLLRCIFQHDPTKRPTAGQVLLHPFFTLEEPLPKAAGSVLETVEGEWHELEYKMMRDKEKAEVRRKLEDNVVVCFLRVKQDDHERKLANAADDAEAEVAILRIDFYKNQLVSYQSKMDLRLQENEEGQNQVKQVAELKKTHGSMYMDSQRRGRYRGPERDKGDEKVIAEAWKWYEEEKRKGNEPVPAPTPAAVKPASEVSLGTSSTLKNPTYKQKWAAYERRLAAYNARKAALAKGYDPEARVEKRAAMSPLVDEREHKKSREDEE